MSITSVELKQANKKKVFLEIYENKTVSKNSILSKLNLSIPTINTKPKGA
jgi:predicted transcriptional regulator